ncbi:protein kinase domain protein [Ichthyophthirius multifiliis]|uniref:Cyclin-dependent kinase 2 homolog n=1 Tax=Ichthyophthirius multifiliis TaxID=5932 RepID=G0R290_ICHMU|nr:protein kinase domain protein [Ichthyophthirius multifiliis]EGR28415.1 protein kinase domain protein [Ichthyophthirius multifiliis]|eukprot:XP_004029651.1 protein kinase domain protein [Ichthyophthirius multifiliis]
MYQLIKGINHIHSSGFIHRDLKPANILITQQGEVKIADFGLSKAINIRQNRMTPGWITLWYRPLEMLLGQQEYSQVVDIWSIGCIFSELINLEPLFDQDKNYDMIVSIIDKRGFPIDWEGMNNFSKIEKFNQWKQKQKQSIKLISRNLCDQGNDLLDKMLDTNPNKRITARQCLQHVLYKIIYKFIQKKALFL